MTKHFNNEAEATTDLTARGYREVRSGSYVSKCGAFGATLHPCPNGMTMVQYREIVRP